MNTELLHTCLHVLNSEAVTEDSFLDVLRLFHEFSIKTENVASNKKDTAGVFYHILRVCQSLYDIDTSDKLPEQVKETIVSCFSNIEHLFLEMSPEDQRGSDVRIIWFLSKIKNAAGEKHLEDITQDTLGEYARELLDVMGDIRFIFDIQVNGEFIFPISRVIASEIGRHDFQRFSNGLTEKDIWTLQLAVRLFENREIYEVLDIFLETCNLQFVNYLGINCEIIDTVDFLNYKFNRTIIFHNDEKKQILIRSERNDYFQGCKDCYEVKEERDCEGNVIGRFVEFDLPEGGKLRDFSDLMKSESQRIAFLKMIFDEGCYNILQEKAILEFPDGRIEAVNPFCYKDEWVVKGRINRKEGSYRRRDEFVELLTEYRACPVKSNIMNCVTLGLCMFLLNQKNIGVSSLNLDSLKEDQWYQEQVINQWVGDQRVNTDDVIIMLIAWYKQLRYCENNAKLGNETLHYLDFLPMRQNLRSILDLISPPLAQDEGIYCGTVQEESESYSIAVHLQETVSGKQLVTQGQKYLTIHKSELSDEESIFVWDKINRKNVWVLYSLAEKKGHVLSQKALKAIAGLELLHLHFMAYETGVAVTQNEYDDTEKRMLLYKECYKEAAIKTKVCPCNDFNTQIYLRIMHNMLWSEITADNKNTYFGIIRAHQIADFDGIEQDPVFQRNDEGTLYVPKDDYNQSAVLSRIYENLLKPAVERDPYPLYETEIDQNEHGKYLVRGKPIEKVVMLTDNFVSGTSTVSALSAYLEIESADDFGIPRWRVEQAKEKMHKYYCQDNIVSIKKILMTNQAVLTVHAYYGTSEGQIKIDSFLASSSFFFEPSSYVKEITVKDEDIINKAKDLWHTGFESPYLFIRRFNMPRKTVFPDEMAGENIFLFVNCFQRNKERGER